MTREKLIALRRQVELGVTDLAQAAIDAELKEPETREWRVLLANGQRGHLGEYLSAEMLATWREVFGSGFPGYRIESRTPAGEWGKWEPSK